MSKYGIKKVFIFNQIYDIILLSREDGNPLEKPTKK